MRTARQHRTREPSSPRGTTSSSPALRVRRQLQGRGHGDGGAAEWEEVPEKDPEGGRSPRPRCPGASPREEAGEEHVGCEVGDAGAGPRTCPPQEILLCSRMRPAPCPPPHGSIPATACPPGSPCRDPHGDTAPRLHPEPTPTVCFQVMLQEGEVLPADGPRPVIIKTLWRRGEEAR